jgi:hypothetical protein
MRRLLLLLLLLALLTFKMFSFTLTLLALPVYHVLVPLSLQQLTLPGIPFAIAV